MGQEFYWVMSAHPSENFDEKQLILFLDEEHFLFHVHAVV